MTSGLHETLHDALAELADEMAPTTVSAPVVPLRADPWRRARTRRRVRGTAAVATLVATGLVGVLVVQGASFGLASLQVQPVSVPAGPGSLPDRIFATRASILSVEQAPIGRAALVYVGPQLLGARAGSPYLQRPIAVGADSDAYRVLPAADTWSLSPDGRTYAYLAPAPVGGYVPSRLHLLDLATGKDRVVALPDRGKGLAASQNTLFWSTDSGHIFAALFAQNPDSGGVEGGAHQRFEVVDVAAGTVSWRDGDGSAMVGWAGPSDVLVQTTAAEGTWEVRDAITAKVLLAGPGSLAAQAGFGAGPQQFVSPGATAVAGPLKPSGNGRFVSISVVTLATGASSVLPGKSLGGLVDLPEVGAMRPVGWLDDSTMAVMRLLQPASQPSAPLSFDLVTMGTDGSTSGQLLKAGPEAAVQDIQVAANVLAGGRVRPASAPSQSLLDLRTLTPAARDWVATHLAAAVVAALLVLLALTLAVRVWRRRRRGTRPVR